MARSIAVPMGVVVLVGVLLAVALGYIWYRGSSFRALQTQMQALELKAHQLSLQLEAEKTRTETYGVEAVQVQQNLKLLENELNRLRAKVKLPPVRLVPAAPSSPSNPPTAQPKPLNGPKGAGEPVDTGSLLLSLRSQMTAFSAELEAAANSIANPLNTEPVRRMAAQTRVAPPKVRLNDLKSLPPVASSTPLPNQSGLPSGVPLATQTRITSTFGYRSNPFSGLNYEFHNGIDFAADQGTAVYATAAGRVSEMGWNRIFGLMVMIDHGNGYHTLYGHLSSTYVEAGQAVAQGSLIGAVGSTGRSTGPHLHYTVFRYGSAVDPSPFIAP